MTVAFEPVVPPQWARSDTAPEPLPTIDPELTDELVRLLNASDYIDTAHRSGDGVVTATTIDGLDISVAVVAIDRSL